MDKILGRILGKTLCYLACVLLFVACSDPKKEFVEHFSAECIYWVQNQEKDIYCPCIAEFAASQFNNKELEAMLDPEKQNPVYWNNNEWLSFQAKRVDFEDQSMFYSDKAIKYLNACAAKRRQK